MLFTDLGNEANDNVIVLVCIETLHKQKAEDKERCDENIVKDIM